MFFSQSARDSIVLLEDVVYLFRPAGGLGGRASPRGVRCGVGHHFLLQVPEHLLHPGAELAPPAQTAAGPPASSQRPLQLLLRVHDQVHPQVWASVLPGRLRLPSGAGNLTAVTCAGLGTVWQTAARSTSTDYCCSITSRNFAPSWTPRRSPRTPTPSTGCVSLLQVLALGLAEGLPDPSLTLTLTLHSWAASSPATAFLTLHRPCGTSTSSRLTPFSSSSSRSSSSSMPSEEGLVGGAQTQQK